MTRRANNCQEADLTDGDALQVIASMAAKKSGVNITQVGPETKLLHDLGVDGDDAGELLQNVADRFRIDMRSFQFDRYFHSESECFFNPFLLIRACKVRFLSQKEPVTISQLAESAKSGQW